MDGKLQAKLRKLLALAERGVGGEKDTAQRMLAKMLARHGLTIDSLSEDERSMTWFKFSNENERRLGRQIAAKVLNTHDADVYGLYSNADRRKQFGVMLSPAEAVEFELHYEVLRKALTKHMETAFQAFIQANNIFPDGSGNADREMTDQDMAVVLMASTMKATEVNARVGHEKEAIDEQETA
ncbi:DUF2786 domain-containing protein [Stutzerimonas nitrititolerans]|uniref:DUF2786 domain-containing protein n=1 Tax=Stutzerimonas nitrititolerans TaxID=2482751 RepID=UPI0028AD00DF|nr:DUF2786 domain-containing protein [Stutzerimonas nitrititolerans]